LGGGKERKRKRGIHEREKKREGGDPRLFSRKKKGMKSTEEKRGGEKIFPFSTVGGGGD